MIFLKTLEQIELLRESNRIVGEVLLELSRAVTSGISTLELDKLAEDIIIKNKALPGFKGYKNYPFTICASVDNIVMHGLPNKTKLKQGSIVSIDVGVLKNGFYGDSAITIPVGKTTKKKLKIIETTERCLNEAIKVALPGNNVNHIATKIQNIAEEAGLKPFKRFVGHGIGKRLHEDPQIPNYCNYNKTKLLKHGMVISIEPVIGETDKIISKNAWEYITEDGSVSAHFEHTILITENGNEVLSKRRE